PDLSSPAALFRWSIGHPPPLPRFPYTTLFRSQEIHARLHEWRTAGGGRQVQDPLAHLARDIAAASPLLCFDEFQIEAVADAMIVDRKSTRLNSSHVKISYAVFCLKNKEVLPVN